MSTRPKVRFNGNSTICAVCDADMVFHWREKEQQYLMKCVTPDCAQSSLAPVLWPSGNIELVRLVEAPR